MQVLEVLDCVSGSVIILQCEVGEVSVVNGVVSSSTAALCNAMDTRNAWPDASRSLVGN